MHAQSGSLKGRIVPGGFAHELSAEITFHSDAGEGNSLFFLGMHFNSGKFRRALLLNNGLMGFKGQVSADIVLLKETVLLRSF
jgi:hypothetical protein